MRELSLFTGAGGGILGTYLLGFRPIGYVEWDDYCQRVLAARIADGHIPSAPIFGDVREFVQSGAAEQYRGFVDVVTAGFPCQPFSVAGRQLGSDDTRNMWPATADVLRVVGPRFVKLENVTGLLTCGYAAVVIADLAAMGYVGRWGCIRAASTGADHARARWWVVAHSTRPGQPYADRRSSKRQLARDGATRRGNGRQRVFATWPSDPAGDAAESRVGRVVNGLAHGMDRLKALGNGQVPRVVTAAWRLLA